MHDQIAVQMMQRCLERITNLEAQVAHLTPKAEAYDRLGALIDMQAGNRNRVFGGEPSMAWNLRMEIEAAQRRMSDEKSKMETRADMDEGRRDPTMTELERERENITTALGAEAAQQRRQADVRTDD